MRTIVFANMKGGVGKTVTAINVAAILAGEHQQRVLLIDADSQGNTTDFFGGDPANGNLAYVLQANEPTSLCIQPTRYPGIDLLASSDTLMDLDLSMLKSGQINSTALRELIISLAVMDDLYDYVLIDCPPAFNAASAAAMVAADDVIIPIKLDAFSLKGMVNLMRQVSNMRQINPRLRVAGCLPTMYYNGKSMEDADHQLRQSALPVFKSRIRRSPKVDGMTFAQEPLCIFSPRSSAGVDYRCFVEEYLRGGSSNEKIRAV